MLYLYAITDAPLSPSVLGLDGEAPFALCEAGVCAVVTEHEDPRVEADETSLLAHEVVVEALLDQGPVLPMRFGSTVADRDELVSLLRSRRAEFSGSLDRVRGAVEVAVRAMAHGRPNAGQSGPTRPEAAGPGTAYLLARLEDEQRAEAMATQIHESLAALARASRISLRTSGPALVNAAYLIDRDRIASFRARVEELDRGLSGATVMSTGPWPPYSFSSEEAQE